jgi:hypothetical protein
MQPKRVPVSREPSRPKVSSRVCLIGPERLSSIDEARSAYSVGCRRVALRVSRSSTLRETEVGAALASVRYRSAVVLALGTTVTTPVGTRRTCRGEDYSRGPASAKIRSGVVAVGLPATVGGSRDTTRSIWLILPVTYACLKD